MKTILFHGPSGSGKDTQVELLVKKYEFENIGTGEMFRAMYKEGDIEAFKAYQHWSKGHLVPNELVYGMLNKWVKRFDPEKHWAFVSVVREPHQIKLFDELLDNANRDLDYFVHFTLPDEIAIERMSHRKICPYCDATYHQKYKPEKVEGYCDKCGTKLIQREDDMPDKMKIRLMEYDRSIREIRETYKERGILIEIDASPSIEEINKTLLQKIGL